MLIGIYQNSTGSDPATDLTTIARLMRYSSVLGLSGFREEKMLNDFEAFLSEEYQSLGENDIGIKEYEH